jgi:DNA-binding transcriptional MerR regulator
MLFFARCFVVSSVEKCPELLNGLLEWRGMPEPAISEQRPEIPDKLYFRIGEVSRLAGIKPYVLRFWETEFSSLGPKKSGKGHRLYRRKDVELVLEIKQLLYDKRYTIEGARKFLDSRPRELSAKMSIAKGEASQPELFATRAPTLEAIRKELGEILQLLS